jgi:threonine/homoserine/homoserine lactone efflux protein
MPQFVTADASNALLHMVGLSAVFMLMTLVIFVVYGRSAAVRNQVISRPSVLTWLRPAFAGAFAGLGARLAFAERRGEPRSAKSRATRAA